MNQLQDEDFKDAIKVLAAEIDQSLLALSSKVLLQLAALLTQSKRVFFAGEGRSGLVARMTAMRMMHLGIQSFVVGETTTPSVKEGDLLFIVSGSGETSIMKLLANTAKKSNATLVVMTTNIHSELAKEADLVVEILAQSKNQSSENSEQFAGSLFEQTALLTLDAVFHALSKRVSKALLMNRHANLE